jgi:N4-gp56 family major capsid protein
MASAPQSTSNLSSSVRTRYLEKYLSAAKQVRVYDEFASDVGIDQGVIMKAIAQGSSVQADFISHLAPASTAISQTNDVTPVALRDATASITPTSRVNAIQWSETLGTQVYTDYGDRAFEAIGENQMESIDLLASNAALQGTNVYRNAVRASLNAGTTADLLTDSEISDVQSELLMLKPPALMVGDEDDLQQRWFATMHPRVYHDLRTGGNVVSVGQYQGKEILINFELGRIGPFKLSVTPWAKVFGAAGADNASAVATTLASSASANRSLDTTIEVAANTNIAAGQILTIGTEETGDTHYGDNEQVKVASVSSTTITIIGSGDNGGLRYDHSVGAAVRNADSVYPVAFGGPKSLAKVYSTGNPLGVMEDDLGQYGVVVGPKVSGVVNQFVTLGWKYYGNYGRWSESWILRGEFASSLDA